MNHKKLGRLYLSILVFACSFPSISSAINENHPAICGLVSMNNMGFLGNDNFVPTNILQEPYAHPGQYKASIIIVRWKDIEPFYNQYDFTPIVEALNNIAAYNAKYPNTPMVGKLRVFAGPFAPDWAKILDGNPITIYSSTSSRTEKVGHFWGGNYRMAWRELQAQLALNFDNHPLMKEVAVASCTSMDDEAFLLPNNTRSIKALHEAGFNDQDYYNCLATAGNDYADWKNAALDYAFNVFPATDSGTMIYETTPLLPLINAWRETLGERGVISNHGLNFSTPINPPPLSMPGTLKSLGAPLEYQLIAPTGDIDKILQIAFQNYNPSEIELFNSTASHGQANYNSQSLAKWAREFKCSSTY